MSEKSVATFIGIDDWDRPVFKSSGLYYCTVELPADNSKQCLESLIQEANDGNIDIYYKGEDFDEEPFAPVSYIKLSLNIEM